MSGLPSPPIIEAVQEALRHSYNIAIARADIERMLASGDLHLTEQLPSVARHDSFLPLDNGLYLIVSRTFSWRYAAYQEELHELQALRATDPSPAAAIAFLDSVIASNPKVSRYCAPVTHFHGVEMVTVPYMGKPTRIARQVMPAMYRLVLQHLLGPHVTGANIVVEIGAGLGDLVVSLARDHRQSTAAFFATDIASNGLACAMELAAAMELSNVRTAEVDATRPELDFLSPGSKVLFFCRECLFMLGSKLEALLDALSTWHGSDFIAFEPLGTLPSQVQSEKEVFFTPEAAERSDSNHDVWKHIASRIQRGQFKLESILPNVAGKNLDIPVSMIHLRVL